MSLPTNCATPILNDLSATESTPEVMGDLLYGAAQIANYLFGDAKQRRKVYYLIEVARLPVFRLGAICARKSTLARWITEQEQAAIQCTHNRCKRAP